MKPFIVATKNLGKLLEIKSILQQFPLKVISMEEAGFYQDIHETGTTFSENAFIKAQEIHSATKGIVMADDSGLEVKYLHGAPGIYSSRYASIGSSAEKKMHTLLQELQGVPHTKRQARFVCSICVFYRSGLHFIVEGHCDGYIAEKPSGAHGFGYDPIFFLPQYQKNMAELPPEIKNTISHRAHALQKMLDQLKNISTF